MKLDILIKDLNLSKSLIYKLEDLNMFKLEDLWVIKKSYLKDNGFTDSEVHQIQIQLQLHSMDFNKKIYKV